MKKFQFAAGLLAMGLLASCSSDAPEAPNGPAQITDEGPTTMVAMRINTGTSTRAYGENYGGDAYAFEDECKINGIVVYVMDGDNVAMQLIADDVVDADDSDNAQYALFELGTIRKSILEGLTGKTVTLKVFANAVENGHTPFGTYTSTNWTDLETWNATNGFIMTNSEESEGVLQPSTNTVKKTIDGTESDVWVLNSVEGDATKAVKVVLTRLATRFDVEEAKNADAPNYNETDKVYTCSNQSTLKIKLEKVAINTHEKGTYWFQQDADASGMTPGATRNFFTYNEDITVPNVTPTKKINYKEDDCRKLLNNQTWKSSLYGTFYARPHYVSTLPEGENNYRRASYVAFKASFTDATLITSGKKYCYAYNGTLLGTLDKMQGKVSSTTDEGLKAIYQLADGLTDDTKFQENAADVKALVVYEADADGNFYTYYNKVLQHSAGAVSADNTDLRRNHIYGISVKNLSGLGHNGLKEPNDPDNDETMIWMELDVEVKDWQFNKVNQGMELGR